MKKLIVLIIAFAIAGALQNGGSGVQAKTNDSVGTEVRWFYEGSLPDSVNQWFLENKRLGELMKENEGKQRVDLYLITNDAPFLGVKLRKGKLEIKFRVQEHNLAMKNGIEGKAEIWRKWEWRGSKGNGAAEDLVAGFTENTDKEFLRYVEKTRWQRKFLIDFNSERFMVPAEKRLDRGILAEITKVEMQGKKCWTMAIEIFGEFDEPYETLSKGVDWILEDYPGPVPLMEKSMSYPSWLLSPASVSEPFTHMVIQSTAYYLNSPAQGKPSDGEFPSGTKVIILQESGSYSFVRSSENVEAYVAAGSLKKIEEP